METSDFTITRFAGAYEFLSNFYAAPVMLDGVEYPSVEHAYQAAKTLDADERQAVRLSDQPAAAKQLGTRLTLRPDWEQIKLDVMRDLLAQKFSLPELHRQLLETGSAQLIEGNTWDDRFWGCIRSETGVWIGENQLGRLLMEIREQLKTGD